MQFAAEKLLSRLTIFARYRKDDKSATRGAGIFGPNSGQSQEAITASIEFLSLLLTGIRAWAKAFEKMSDGSISPYQRAYLQLVKEGVQFPVDPGAKDSSAVHGEVNLEQFVSSAMLLGEIAAAGDGRTQASVELSEKIEGQLKALKPSIQKLAESVDEVRLQEYLDAIETAENALESFRRLPNRPQTTHFDFDFDLKDDVSQSEGHLSPAFDFDSQWEEGSLVQS